MPPLRALCTVLLFAVLLVAGCAVPIRTPNSSQTEAALWRGRLAVRLEADSPQTQAQSFAAEFELTGNAQTGELTLFTPLGTTAAALSWSAQTAILRSDGVVRHFGSLDALIKHAVGTELPVTALFAWLAGDGVTVAGWSADLSQYVKGRITAHRTEPAPLAELRLVLER